MTIQRTLLCSVAGLILSTTANAQCSRVRPIYTPPTYGHLPQPRQAREVFRPSYRTAGLREQAPTPLSITFGGCSHVDQLAARLEVLMNELCLDLYYNYNHNPGFQATYAEAYSLYSTAKFIHASEQNFDRTSVQRSLAGVDALFHHIHDDVRGWMRIPRRQIGTLDIATKINLAEETLHQLMQDVGVHPLPIHEEPPVPEFGQPGILSVPPVPTEIP